MVEYDVQPLNVDSQDTANAELVRATYNVTGKNVCVLIEEAGGMVRKTHQEFSNGQTSRVTWHSTHSNSILSNHATHVAGTIGASGENLNAKGFAPDCSMISVLAWYMTGGLYVSESNTSNFQLSNHSWTSPYGYITTNHHITNIGNIQFIQGWNEFLEVQNQRKNNPEFKEFGKYHTEHSKNTDRSCYDASTVLSVWASGNYNRAQFIALGTVTVDNVIFDSPISSNINVTKDTLFSTYVNEDGVREFWHSGKSLSYELPFGNYGPSDHDSLNFLQVCKNTLVVGSIADITSEDDAQREGVVSAFSSRGPTDDGRIKPEIVANGESLYGSIAASDTTYASYGGTSMACPSVTGCAALNLEYYRRIINEPNGRIPSATLKALMLLTAFRNDKPPTYTKGYGVADVSASLGFLSKWNNSNVNNANYVYLQEHTCHGKANTIEIYPKALDTSVNIMVCWNDYYELRTNDVHDHRFYVDSSHSVITNPLLVKCSNESIAYMPWYLNVNNPSATARNAVHAGTLDDTYEIKAPHDNTKLIEFMPTGSGRHTLTVSLSPSLLVDGIKPNNATGQKYTIAIQNARSQSTIIYFRQNPSSAFSAPYYKFYSDANHSSELSSPCVLETGKSYDFRYYGGDSGHPFWIGSSASGAEITSAPSGRDNNSGIQSGENFTLSIDSDYDGDLHYYCTSHSTMSKSFRVTSPSSGALSSSAVGDPYVYPLFVNASNRPQGHMRRRVPSSDAPVKLPDVAASYCMLNSRRLGLAVNASVGRASADHQQRMVWYARELQASGHAEPSIPISDIVTDGFFFQELVIRLDADLGAATPRQSRLLQVDLANKELRASDSEAFRYEWVDEEGTSCYKSVYRTEQFEEPCQRLRISWTPNRGIGKSDADDNYEWPPLNSLDVLFFENPHLENGIEMPMPNCSDGVLPFRMIENGDTRGLLMYEYDTPLRMQVDSLTTTEYTRGDLEGERLPPHRVKHETWHWHGHGHCDGECVAA